MKITRIYLLRNLDTAEETLIRAVSGAQALRHATRGAYTVNVASTENVAALMAEGGKVEDVGEDEAPS